MSSTVPAIRLNSPSRRQTGAQAAIVALRSAVDVYLRDKGIPEGSTLRFSIDGGLRRVERTISSGTLEKLHENIWRERSYAHLAQGLMTYFNDKGKPDVAQAITTGMNQVYGGRLVWDHRLAAFNGMKPEELIALNPSVIDALKKGLSVYLCTAHHMGIHASGFIVGGLALELAPPEGINGRKGTYVELKLKDRKLTLVRYAGTNAEKLADALLNAHLVQPSPEYVASITPKLPQEMDAKERAICETLDRAVALYLQEKGVDCSRDLEIDGGFQKVKTVIKKRILEGLQIPKFYRHHYIPLAQGLITYFQEKGDRAHAGEIIQVMNAYYGGRLEWDRRLAALKGMTVTELIEMDPAAARELKRGRTVYLAGMRQTSIDKDGFFSVKVWMQPKRPGDFSPYVRLHRVGKKLALKPDSQGRAYGGVHGARLAQALVDAGLATSEVPVVIRQLVSRPSLIRHTFSISDPRTVAATLALKAGLTAYLSEHGLSSQSDLVFNLNTGVRSLSRRITVGDMAALSQRDDFRNRAFSHLAQGLITHLGEKHADLRSQILTAMNDLFGHRLYWDKRIAAFDDLSRDEFLSLNPEALRWLEEGRTLYFTVNHGNEIDLNGILFGIVALRDSPPEIYRAPFVAFKKRDKKLILTGRGPHSVLLAKSMVSSGLLESDSALEVEAPAAKERPARAGKMVGHLRPNKGPWRTWSDAFHASRGVGLVSRGVLY